MKKLGVIGVLLLGLAFTAAAQQSPASPIASPIEPIEKLMRLYPNPAVSYITFEFKSAFKRGLSLQIYNGILGKKMVDTRLNIEKITLSLNEFSRGIYVYHLVETSGKIIESGKFQVTK
jgi:hypothetical protein